MSGGDLLTFVDLQGRGPDSLPDTYAPPSPEAVAATEAIIADVRRRGDDALRELGERFDGAAPANLAVPAGERLAALQSLDEATRRALTEAHRRIWDFHRRSAETRPPAAGGGFGGGYGNGNLGGGGGRNGNGKVGGGCGRNGNGKVSGSGDFGGGCGNGNGKVSGSGDGDGGGSAGSRRPSWRTGLLRPAAAGSVKTRSSVKTRRSGRLRRRRAGRPARRRACASGGAVCAWGEGCVPVHRADDGCAG